MYKKIIKNKEDLHLPMQIDYDTFHKLSAEDKAKYLFIDGHYVTKPKVTDHSDIHRFE